jgi:hypothetical protein
MGSGTAAAGKAVGKWKITETGDSQCYPWATDIKNNATFTIQVNEGEMYFVPGKGFGGVFAHESKVPVSDLDLVMGKLRVFHDCKDVSAHSFVLSMTLDDKTFVFTGWRRKSSGGPPDAGRVEIATMPPAQFKALRNAGHAGFIRMHGGPHGEPV